MGSILAFDIETVRRPIPASFKEDLKNGTLKIDSKTMDPSKIIKRIKEKFWTQPEGARPIAIAFCEINFITRTVLEPVGYATDDEEKLCKFLIDGLSSFSPTKLIGYNSSSFDLPALEHMLINYPGHYAKGIGKWDHLDLAMHVPPFFAARRPLKGTGTSACALYGVEHSGSSGEDVATMWAEDKKGKRTSQVLEHCKADAKATAEVYLKMSKLRAL